MADPPRLLDLVREALRVRHRSRRTEEAYVHCIRRFIVYHRRRHPRELGAPGIRAFLAALVEQRATASTSNQALGALLFLYRHVLDRDLGRLEDMPRGRLPERLPVVLTRDEVRRRLAELHGRSARAKGLSPRHARLAVGAVATLVQFLFDTHGERKHS